MLKREKPNGQSAFSPYKTAVIAALAAGLYPIIFYYTNNYSLINSWKHLGFFIAFFLLVPVVSFVVATRLFQIDKLQKWAKYVLSFLNVATFLMFIQLCLYAKMQWHFTVIIIMIAGVFAFFFHYLLKRLITLQFILLGVGLFWLIPTIRTQLNYSSEWMQQPDDIEQVTFKKRPNIYYIQPDGYVNFSEINRGYFNIDNSAFKSFLEENAFTNYPDIRSNYTSTLVSNSASFAMKHHYYNNGFNFTEIANAREIIISKNPVLDIFKSNNYKTHFVAEMPYLLDNFPDMGYDACNFDYNDVSYIAEGYPEKDVLIPMKKFLEIDTLQSKFFFIEIFKPGHVSSNATETLGAEKERALYISNLKIANGKLVNLINLIKEKDPNGLILLMADHGGFAGYDNMLDIRIKTDDRDKLFAGFSTQLSIKWPDNNPPQFDTKFKTGVNVFRILFSYLSEDEKYLEHLQDDGSYTIIDTGAPKGVYKVINENDEVSFEKH